MALVYGLPLLFASAGTFFVGNAFEEEKEVVPESSNILDTTPVKESVSATDVTEHSNMAPSYQAPSYAAPTFDAPNYPAPVRAPSPESSEDESSTPGPVSDKKSSWLPSIFGKKTPPAPQPKPEDKPEPLGLDRGSIPPTDGSPTPIIPEPTPAPVVESSTESSWLPSIFGSKTTPEPVKPVEVAVVPEAVVPEAVVPEAVVPEAVVPEAVVPETVVPEAVVPETVVPEAVVPEAVVPEAVVPEAVVPETVVPEAVVPEAVVPEAVVPETVVPTVPAVAQVDKLTPILSAKPDAVTPKDCSPKKLKSLPEPVPEPVAEPVPEPVVSANISSQPVVPPPPVTSSEPVLPEPVVEVPPPPVTSSEPVLPEPLNRNVFENEIAGESVSRPPRHSSKRFDLSPVETPLRNVLQPISTKPADYVPHQRANQILQDRSSLSVGEYKGAELPPPLPPTQPSLPNLTRFDLESGSGRVVSYRRGTYRKKLLKKSRFGKTLKK